MTDKAREFTAIALSAAIVVLSPGLEAPRVFAAFVAESAAVRTASSGAPAVSAASVGAGGLSAVDVVDAVRLSLELRRWAPDEARTDLSGAPLVLGPEMLAAAVAHGLSPQSAETLARIAALSQAAGSAKAEERARSSSSEFPGTEASPTSDAASALMRMDRILSGIPAESVDDPEALRSAQDRIWGELAAVRSADGFPRTGEDAASRDAEGVRRDSRLYWDARRDEILAQAQLLRRFAAEHTSRLEGILGRGRLDQEIDKSRVVVTAPLGKAETTTVDGNRVIRVVHAPTQLSLVFLDEGSVLEDSGHLRQIIARQFFDAGVDRSDGRAGRNPVVVWLRDGAVSSAEFHEKPSVWSGSWWRHYWRATYKTPASGDVVFGVAMGVLQGVLAAALGVFQLAAFDTPIVWAPVVFTTVFGTVIGVFSSSYRNWTYRGGKAKQFLKSAAISVAFAYPVVAFVGGAAALLSMSTHIRVMSNVLLNNVGKVSWQQIPVIGERHRQFTGTFVWGIKKAAVVNQAFYMVNWTLRLADLVGMPGGKLILVAGIPVAELLSYWYARKHGFPEAEQIRRKPVELLRRASGALRRLKSTLS